MNQLALLSAVSGVRMTSSEIAKLVEKRPDNVKRTIETLVESGAIVHPQIEDEQIIDALGRPRAQSVFVFEGEQGKRDSIVVVAQLSPLFTAKLVDRWQELESKVAASRHASSANSDQFELVRQSARLVSPFMEAAKAFGFTDNHARLSADSAVLRVTGVSVLSLMGQSALVADKKELTYTATELGKMLVPALSAKVFNDELIKFGLAERINKKIEPTAKGRDFCEVIDIGKKSGGAPVKQVKWFKAVLGQLVSGGKNGN